MTSFKKSALAVFTTLNAAWLPSTALARKGSNGLFSDSKSSKEPTNQPVSALNPNPTSIPTNRPTTNRPSAKPSAKPSPSTGVEIGGVFEFVGRGYCRDADANNYDYVRFDLEGFASVNACGSICPITASFRAIEASLSNCKCLYDNNSYDGDIIERGDGEGPVVDSYGIFTLAECYKFTSDSVTREPVTAHPTTKRTTKPSIQPTATPTVQPPASPTALPSSKPTNAPSANPTEQPSSSPSDSPTAQPTASPTASPSLKPTNAPSANPSEQPSSSPSDSPTAQPTVSPSFSPAVSPSLSPSDSPSANPSEQLSSSPSDSPTAQPTVSPSFSPTVSPSLSPSDSPSVNPSEQPSSSPSDNPTAQPTVSPSFSPTVSPSSSPSDPPSTNLTEQPSSLPSPSPTPAPSSSFFLLNSYANKLISIKGGVCSDGNIVELQQNGNLDWQTWVLNFDNSIESVYCPGMVIDIDGDESTCANGLIIISAKTEGRDSQIWSLRENGAIESKMCPKMGVDIQGFGTQPGAPMHLWSLTLSWNQLWSRIEVTSAPSPSPTLSTSPSISMSPSDSPSDPIFIRNAYTDKVITINDGLCVDRNSVELRQDDYADWQKWLLNHDGSIESVHCPGMVLDLAAVEGNRRLTTSAEACKNGLPIIISAKTNGRTSQMWSLSEDGLIESKMCPTMGIDIRGFGTQNGAHLHLWTRMEPVLEWNQAWNIVHVKFPTSSPSLTPSASPSATPSAFPAGSPSTSPSISSIESPSEAPSSNPSVSPSANPTTRPSTAITSKMPTRQPSTPGNVTCHCEPAEPIRRRNLLEKSFESQLRLGMTMQKAEKGDQFVIDEALLDELKFNPPVVQSGSFDSDTTSVTTDVVSMASSTRLELIKTQMMTWGSHRTIRNFWGFTERNDFFSCSSTSDEELESYVNTCRSMARKDQRIQDFFTRYYGISEGNRTRSSDTGWVCAQRRLGRAFGWLHTQYYVSGHDIPDYLFIVDDDTFVDTTDVTSYLLEHQPHGNSGLLMRAGCLFEKNDETIPFNFPYGGFGLFLNKIALEQMSRPIHCAGGIEEDEFCYVLHKNSIGEMDIFHNGMTLFELFYRFSATKQFCMHSDWLSGYIVEFYLSGSTKKDAEADNHDALHGMKTFPMCGNRTAYGKVRHCGLDSDTCHNMGEKDMEYLSLASYAKSPLGYKNAPALPGTDWSEVLGGMRGKSHAIEVQLPNVLIIGAPETGSSAVADWLLSNGACHAEIFDEPYYYTKEVHFFDHQDRYDQGLSFYAKRYKHCSQVDHNNLILDATPNYLMYSQHVHDLYRQAGGDFLSELKMIVILREPIAREAASYKRKVQEYKKSASKVGWFSDVAVNGTIMSFEDYSDLVLKSRLVSTQWMNPGKYVEHLKQWTSLFARQQLLVLSYDEVKSEPKAVQWRVTEFLGIKNVHKDLNSKPESDQLASGITNHAVQVLQPLFSQSNDELYSFLSSEQGPWMEQPFPRFTEHKRFAYATVLGWSPSTSQNKLYLDAVRVLIRSIKETGTSADIVVLMTYHDPKSESLLMKEHAIVKHIDLIEHSQDMIEFEPWFVDIAFAKLRAFELTKYYRVQLIDADVAIEKSLDNLFAAYPHSELVSEGLGADSPLRAGWMMLQPSKSNFNAMEGILKTGSFDKVHGWQYLDLPVEYPGFVKSGEQSRSDWNFYGSSLEQGLLFHFFYAAPKYKNPAANDFNLLKLIGDEELQGLGIVHFYGDRKPWSKVRARLPGSLKAAQERWLQAYKSLDSTGARIVSHDNVVPLTQSGSEQYAKARILYGYYNLEPTSKPTNAPTSSPTAEICKCAPDTTSQGTNNFTEPL